MLEVKNVTKYYGNLLAVDNISFKIDNGKIFGLLGTNGAGKSTSFKMIMGLLEPTSGKILFDGKKVNYETTKDIGYLIEERSLMPKWQVYDQLFFIGKLKEMDDELIEERIDYYLDRFECLDFKYKKIKELSKGNQQKIQFIASIINNPKLLILDEPFSGLDPFNIELFVSVIREFERNGSIIIFSSHQMNHVEEFCEELMILVKGEVVLQGNIKQIKEDYAKKVIEIIGEVDAKVLESIKGVIKVEEDKDCLRVLVESNDYVDKVFDYVKTCKNIRKFETLLPSLNDIFIDKVGKAYEG